MDRLLERLLERNLLRDVFGIARQVGLLQNTNGLLADSGGLAGGYLLFGLG